MRLRPIIMTSLAFIFGCVPLWIAMGAGQNARHSLGTGIIGGIFARMMTGFGCEVLAYDVHPNPECVKLGVSYVPLDELFARSQAISLHCPLMPQTHHLIDEKSLARMGDGVFIVNTSRGPVVDEAGVVPRLPAADGAQPRDRVHLAPQRRRGHAPVVDLGRRRLRFNHRP